MSVNTFAYVKEGASLWFSTSFPCYLDLDLGHAHRVSRVALAGSGAGRCALRLYGSLDDLSFDRLRFHVEAEAGEVRLTIDGDRPLRWLRVQVVDFDAPPADGVDAVRVEAESCDAPAEPAPDPIAAIVPWRETEYAREVTPAETEAYLSGLVGRVLGEDYMSQIRFRLAPGTGDRYRVCACRDGAARIAVEGTTGVAMAAGLNAYLKACCGVHVAEQEKQVRVPEALPQPEAPLTGAAADAVRYANNYCTLSYTMPFWDEAAWQRELDWLALSGVNVVLDFTGMEAVWTLFLRRLGCAEEEIERFIVGPVYTAWQLMQNIQGIGGPVHRGFIADRAALARRNQRKMRLLGISPVRQAYAGMLPAGGLARYPELRLFPQGLWNGIQRPDMLDPTSPEYARFAALFYACQEEILGDASHYYAVDPYHEGGNRPAELTDGVVARRILSSLLEADAHAVWMVQAWHDNPSAAFLGGLDADAREHLMILDLSATDNPRYPEGEFMGTPWIYCMLDMYGGRRSIHGEADVLAARIPAARAGSGYMAGVGSTAEATCHNPVVFELLYEMAWHDQPVDLDAWIADYARRRYGHATPGIITAWKTLLETAYRDPGYSHHGGYTQMFTYRPRLSMHSGEVFNELNSEIIKPPYYDPRTFWRAVRGMMAAYEEYRDAPCFIYDLQDLLRQMLNLLGTQAALGALRAYRAGDAAGFEAAAGDFMALLDACDDVMRVRGDTLLSAWSGRAADCGAKYDDYSEDMFGLVSRALVTTWGYREAYKGLADYAYRQYGGLLRGFYRDRWRLWFDRLRAALQTGGEARDVSPEEWFAHDWRFVLEGVDGERDRAPLSPDAAFPPAMALLRDRIGWLDAED